MASEKHPPTRKRSQRDDKRSLAADPKTSRKLGPVAFRDVAPGRSLEVKCSSGDFFTFVESSPEEAVVGFFRDICREVEDRRQLKDFHMKIQDGHGEFRVLILYGEENVGPEEVSHGECISCFVDAPLYPGKEPGVTSGQCVLEEFSDQGLVLCSIDAKARPGFIITPVRHVERLSDLEDRELFCFWHVAVRALRSAGLPFRSMILNHGTYRNLPHLHLKVWVDETLHSQARMRWSVERRELWARLLELSADRPRKQRECRFFGANKSCRQGDRCSFLHVTRR